MRKEKEDIKLDEKINNGIREMILEEEQILWTGKTESYAIIRYHVPIYILLLAIFAYIAAAAISEFKDSLDGGLINTLGILPKYGPLIVFPLFLIGFIYFTRRDGYILTNQRLIIFSLLAEKEFSLLSIHGHKFQKGNKNTGTIVLRIEDRPEAIRYRHRFRNYHIQGITDADEVYQKLKDAMDMLMNPEKYQEYTD